MAIELNLVQVRSDLEKLALDARKYLDPKEIKAERKPDGSWVTSTDKAIDESVIERLRELYPGVAILTEESKDDLSRLDSEYCFIIDPLDGSVPWVEGRGIVDLDEFVDFVKDNGYKLGEIDEEQEEQIYEEGYSMLGVQAFLKYMKDHNGDEQRAIEDFRGRISGYSTLLSLVHNGDVVCGIIHLPAHGVTYSAAKGLGSEKIFYTRSEQGEMTEMARYAIELPLENDGEIVVGRYSRDDALDKLLDQMGTSFEEVAHGGSIGEMTAGVTEGFWGGHLTANLYPTEEHKVTASEWDIAAGAINITEACGDWGTLRGERMKFNDRENPRLMEGFFAIGQRDTPGWLPGLIQYAEENLLES